MIATLFVTLVAWTLSAQRNIATGVNGFGAGIILGEPTGINAKLVISPPAAFDIGLAWSFTDATRPGFSFVLYGDYLFHMFDLVKVPAGQLGFYCGVGGLVNLRPDNTAVTLRIPLGVTYVFANVPLDVFLELVPGMQLFPETRVAGFAGLGIRYWFKW